MATGSARQVVPPPETRVSADKLITSQLSLVRRHIRITDLIAGIMFLLAGMFTFLTLVAIVDHWIIGLGVVGRFIALFALLTGIGWHLAVNVVPLLFRRINPAYAAQTIERGEPQLKNSLLNYLLLRHETQGVPALVYQAVQQRAAADVSHVEVESTVDRTALIRAGYILSAIMAMTAAYKILSPKDPFQTFRRVASPWSDIARPARVTIEAVEPGNAEVVQGQSCTVSAIVRGAATQERVMIIYSTADGQIVSQSLGMELDSGGLRHVSTLPPGSAGIQQDLVYRIVAGDAETPDFRLRASPAPTITVESLEYDFPAYTRRVREIVTKQGDIKAVEGSRVTIRAQANQPIKTATIELSSAAASKKEPATERLPMEFTDNSAWRSWMLELAADRETAKFSSYQAHFINQVGIASRHPVTHRIEVIPDLPPEIEILTPNKETVSVPVGGEQRIELRAIDPDFGLTNIRLQAVVGEREILDESLFEDSVGQSGQSIVTFRFKPRDYQLSPGSRVSYWAVATDNRATQLTPQPNTRRTSNRLLLIVANPPGESATTDQRTPEEKPNPANDAAPMPPSQDSTKDPNRPEPQSDTTNESNPSQQKPSGGTPDSKHGKQQGESGKAQSGGQSQKGSGEKSSTGQDSTGQQQPGQQQPGQQQPGQQQPGQQQSDDAKPAERTEPLHDGEVFERALERLKQSPSKQPKKGDPNERNEQQPPQDETSPTSPDSASTDNSKGGDETKQKQPSNGKSKQEGKSISPNGKSEGQARGSQSSKESSPSGEKKHPEELPQDQPPEASAGKAGEPPPPNQDQRPSDAKGQESGDRRGVGKKGGGQGTKQPGKDKPGSSSPADEGAGAAEETGTGEPSGAAGKQQPSGAPNQSAGKEQGPGSETKSSSNATGKDSGMPPEKNGSNQDSTDKSSSPPKSQDGAAPATPPGEPKSKETSDSSGEAPGDAGTPQGGGGVPSDRPVTNPPTNGEVPLADKANLDYSQRATDLVLDYLKNQQDKPDEQLLDELDWTPEDLRKFVERWQKLKESAADDPAARRELDDTLRGLGLRSLNDSKRVGGRKSDDVRGLRESGIQSAPPASYQEQFKAFKKGAARSVKK